MHSVLARPLNAALAHRCVRLALLFQEGGFREKKLCAFDYFTLHPVQFLAWSPFPFAIVKSW
jgi:hypothetical protein